MRKDLFDILNKFNESNKEKLDDESKRYVERSLIEGKQDGKLFYECFFFTFYEFCLYVNRFTFGRNYS